MSCMLCEHVCIVKVGHIMCVGCYVCCMRCSGQVVHVVSIACCVCGGHVV